MIHTKDLEKIVLLALASAYLINDKPASLMIVSERPESGKTELVRKFGKNKGIVMLSDVTAFSMWRDLHDEIEKGKIKHIIIPEFLAPLSRRTSLDSLIATFQMMIEEGLTEIHSGFLKEAIKFSRPIVVGLIVCMPLNAYAANKPNWEMLGFLSRFLLVTYKYDGHTIDAIFDNIMEEEHYQQEDKESDFNPAMVNIPRPIAEKCLALSTSITQQARNEGKLYGFRELKNIKRLVRANALLKATENKYKDTGASDRLTATEEDFNEISRLSYLFNEDFNALRE